MRNRCTGRYRQSHLLNPVLDMRNRNAALVKLRHRNKSH